MASISDADPAANFLSSLPHSRCPVINPLTPSPEYIREYIVDPGLIDALVLFPFLSPLPPLSTPSGANRIYNLSSSLIPPSRLLQRLESLIAKVYRHLNPPNTSPGPHFGMFGPLYYPANARYLLDETRRLGKLACGDSYDLAADTLAHKSSRLSRYSALLEHLMYMAPYEEWKVFSELKGQLETAHTLAFQKKIVLARTATDSLVTTTPPELTTAANVLEDILKEELPLAIKSMATVARLVILAWTLSVGYTKFGDGSFEIEGFQGDRVPLDGSVDLTFC